MPPRDWRPIVEDFTRVQRLVHLSWRLQPEDAVDVQQQIFGQKRRAYEDQLATEAAAVGCAGRKGVSSPVTLSRMMEESREEALGIINTYNYDAAVAIRNIYTETPTANRNVYAKRLADWEEIRADWKSKQILLWDTTKWQDQATVDFLANNPELADGYAIVQPQSTAVCDVCRYWVGQGKVPINRMEEQRFPVHVNCPHTWDVHYKGKADDCSKLWVGATIDTWMESLEGGMS